MKSIAERMAIVQRKIDNEWGNSAAYQYGVARNLMPKHNFGDRIGIAMVEFDRLNRLGNAQHAWKFAYRLIRLRLTKWEETPPLK